LAHVETIEAAEPFAPTISRVRAEIEADQQELEMLIGRLQISQSTPRQVVAWLGEKASQIKLRLDDPADGALRLLESLEAVAIGVQGKRGLWAALRAAAVSGLHENNYERLIKRADDQHRQLEAIRLEVARAVLA
jgi:hypothetical protein